MRTSCLERVAADLTIVEVAEDNVLLIAVHRHDGGVQSVAFDPGSNAMDAAEVLPLLIERLKALGARSIRCRRAGP